jgi:hypothetical protein
MRVTVTNMIPNDRSGESVADAEVSLAVDPTNADRVAATVTYSPDPQAGALAPVYVRTNGTWTERALVPGGGPTSGMANMTAKFGPSGRLYVAAIRDQAPYPLEVLSTSDPSTAPSLASLFLQSGGAQQVMDQPFLAVAPTADGAGHDRIYVGINDENARPRTATLLVSFNAEADQPNFQFLRLDSGAVFQQDAPCVRAAVHASGAVYAAFIRNTGLDGNQITIDVVVAFDSSGGTGPNPFATTTNVVSGATTQDPVTVGLQHGGDDLAIAVDPTDVTHAAVAWGDVVGGVYTLHLSESTDQGATWTQQVAISNAVHPALSFNAAGELAFAYQQLTTGVTRWETHVRLSHLKGRIWVPATGAFQDNVDLAISTTPPAPAPDQGHRYLGDYMDIASAGRSFYGVFAAFNVPDPNNFPSADIPSDPGWYNRVTYQRGADFGRHVLLDATGATVPPSVDPFFYSITFDDDFAAFEGMSIGAVADSCGVVAIAGGTTHVVCDVRITNPWWREQASPSLVAIVWSVNGVIVGTGPAADVPIPPPNPDGTISPAEVTATVRVTINGVSTMATRTMTLYPINAREEFLFCLIQRWKQSLLTGRPRPIIVYQPGDPGPIDLSAVSRAAWSAVNGLRRMGTAIGRALSGATAGQTGRGARG